MKTYYKDGVFYSEASHGTKKLTIPDPEWVCPTKTIGLMPGEAVWSASGELVRNEHTTFTPDDTDEIEIVVIDVVVRDKTATQPTIEIDNPDCMIPPDAVEVSEELHMSLLVAEAEGKIIKSDQNGLPVTVDPQPSFEEKKKQLTSAIQFFMDSKARDIGYDDLKTAITYAEEPTVPKFQAEGKALRAWRSMVWAYCYELLDKVEKAEVEEPTLDYVLSNLPPLSI